MTSNNAPPFNPYQKRAAGAYRTNAFQTMSGQEILIQVLHKVIHHLTFAKECYLAKNIEEMTVQNDKTLHILGVVRGELEASDALSDPESAPAAQFLLKTYTDSIVRLANILLTKPPETEFDALIELYGSVVKQLQAVIKQPQPANDALPPSEPIDTGA